MLRPLSLLKCAMVLCLVSLGCSTSTPVGGTPGGKGLGDACSFEEPCRSGLVCNATTNVCEGSHAVADGEACTIGLECTSGYCAPGGRRGKCGAAGMLPKGAQCKGDGDCVTGLKCAFDGETLFPKCVPAGTKDIGGDCTSSRDCTQGLFCKDAACAFVPLDPSGAPNGYPPVIPNPAALWQGATCPADTTGAVTALWELPRASDPADVKQDFYRLPYPNDAARQADGSIDYSRYPHDPAPPFGFDALDRYLQVLKNEPFSNYAATIFRFNGAVDFAGFSAQGASPQTRLVDLTAGPRFAARRGLYFQLSGSRNRYVCPNWFALRPFTADVMLPGTYAVILLKGVKDTKGIEVVASTDFQAMLGAAAPVDPVLAAAWPSYAPLRTYLSMESIAPSTVLTASVFTVGDGQRLMKSLAQSVAALPVPTNDAWVKCGSGAPSPCPDATAATGRACGTSTAFDEWHTMIDLPIFQAGTAPYLTPTEGGSISSAGGVLTPVRREKICAAMTTPKGTPPAGGWPVVLYAHGTGGSFRSHAGDGAAGAVADLSSITGGTADGGTLPTGYAMIGFDQVGHGPRRGTRTDVSPDDIVFNFANPASARGTMTQGATDLIGVAMWAKGLGGAGDGGTAPLDTTHVVYWGHSQGATEGALFLANDRTVDGALLSGASASLTDALLSKKAPINIADSMWIALSESSPLAVDSFHPVLSLLQAWIDPADPINFARNVVVLPADGATPAFARHIFQIWGKSDLYTARPVQNAFALAAGLAFVGPKVDEFTGTVQASVSGNITTPRVVTAAMRQYDPGTGAYDGHFVAFKDATARRDAVRFLVRAATGDVPRIPEP